MNATVVRLTARALLGRRRALVLVVLPSVLLVLAVLVRAVSGQDPDTAVTLLDGLALGTVVPLLGVIVGTGVLGPEIDDGSIVYLLSKPLDRRRILLSKLAVAVAASLVLAALPVLLAGLILAGGADRLALGYFVAAAVAGTAYCAVFLLLAVLTRNAVIVGLLYALIWETTVAGVVPGAQALSIRQWALSIAERIAPASDASSAVGLGPGVVLLLAVTVGAGWWATRRLRTLDLHAEQ